MQQFLRDKTRNKYQFSLKESKKDGSKLFSIGTSYKFTLKKDFKVATKDVFLVSWMQRMNAHKHNDVVGFLATAMLEYECNFENFDPKLQEGQERMIRSTKNTHEPLPNLTMFSLEENVDIVHQIFTFLGAHDLLTMFFVSKSIKATCNSREIWNQLNKSYVKNWKMDFPKIPIGIPPKETYKTLIHPLLSTKIRAITIPPTVRLDSRQVLSPPTRNNELEPERSYIALNNCKVGQCNVYRVEIKHTDPTRINSNCKDVYCGISNTSIWDSIQQEAEETRLLYLQYHSHFVHTPVGKNQVILEMFVHNNKRDTEVMVYKDGSAIKWDLEPEEFNWWLNKSEDIFVFLSFPSNIEITLLYGPGSFAKEYSKSFVQKWW